jgi:hypothetical protein
MALHGPYIVVIVCLAGCRWLSHQSSAGIARLLLTQTAGYSTVTVSAVVVVVVRVVINQILVLSFLLLIHVWRMMTRQSRMIFFSIIVLVLAIIICPVGRRSV